jgi:hypothetical protein
MKTDINGKQVESTRAVVKDTIKGTSYDADGKFE